MPKRCLNNQPSMITIAVRIFNQNIFCKTIQYRFHLLKLFCFLPSCMILHNSSSVKSDVVIVYMPIIKMNKRTYIYCYIVGVYRIALQNQLYCIISSPGSFLRSLLFEISIKAFWNGDIYHHTIGLITWMIFTRPPHTSTCSLAGQPPKVKPSLSLVHLKPPIPWQYSQQQASRNSQFLFCNAYRHLTLLGKKSLWHYHHD